MKTLKESILGSMGMGDKVTWMYMISPILIECYKMMKADDDWEFDESSMSAYWGITRHAISFTFRYKGKKTLSWGEDELNKMMVDVMDKLHYDLQNFYTQFSTRNKEPRKKTLQLTFDHTGKYTGYSKNEPYKFRITIELYNLNKKLEIPPFDDGGDNGGIRFNLIMMKDDVPELTQQRLNNISQEVKKIVK